MDFFPFEMSLLFFTLMADYDQFWHVSSAFNWLHRPIMYVCWTGKKYVLDPSPQVKYPKTTSKYGYLKLPEFRSFYPLSPLLVFLFYASNHLKTFMKFYLTFDYS